MSDLGMDAQMTACLHALNAAGGYPMSLVCTDNGLLIASAGEDLRSEVLAALVSLFDDIASRAARDLDMTHIDELSFSDTQCGHIVVRPLPQLPGQRLFLVVQVPRHRTWRRRTSAATRHLETLLRPLLTAAAASPRIETS